jgi:cell wall-associated NlpC family hydrolase
LKYFTKIVLFSVCAIVAAVCLNGSATAQGRDRVIKPTSSRPTNLPPAQPRTEKVESTVSAHPTLTNDVVVVKQVAPPESLVKKTVLSAPVNTSTAAGAARKAVYNSATSTRLDQAIKARYGLPYHYGSTGPNSYDCSGFVWSAFNEAGISFTRSSAKAIWNESEPVDGPDRYKYGTLVFFNGLGHIGIVADENGFYQASSSKGITYSQFKGYWEKRIVGFRRLKAGYSPETASEPDKK